MNRLDRECDHLGCYGKCNFKKTILDTRANIAKVEESIDLVLANVEALMENKDAKDYYGFKYTAACAEAFLALRAAVEALNKVTK